MSTKQTLLALIILFMLPVLACGGGEPTPTSAPVISTATPDAETADTDQPGEIADQDIETVTEEEAAEPVEEDTPTPEPTETPEPARQAHIGDFVTNEGYSLTVLQVQDPATPGMLYSAEPGSRLIAVEVVIGNVSGATATTNALNGILLDEERLTYRAELAGTDDQLPLVELESGERVQGWIAFEIPEDAAPATFRFEMNRVRLEASLLEPPADHEPMEEPDGLFGVSESLSRLGDLVEQDGYSLAAMEVEDPASPGILYQATPGLKLVAVDMIVGNVDAGEITVNALRTYLVDSDGYVYTAELAGTDNQIELVDLGPDERVRGKVAFEVPEDAVPAAIKYEVSGSPRIVIYAGLLE
jgi:hypothetical protein